MDKIIEFLKKLDPIDFAYGALFGALALLFGAGWFGLFVTVPVCMVLWAVGGSIKKAWRRVGCALTLALTVWATTGNPLALLAGLATYGLLSLGYGIPSTQPYDEGSWLGRYTFRWAKENENLATLYARGIIYAAVWLSFFSVSILRGVL